MERFSATPPLRTHALTHSHTHALTHSRTHSPAHVHHDYCGAKENLLVFVISGEKLHDVAVHVECALERAKRFVRLCKVEDHVWVFSNCEHCDLHSGEGLQTKKWSEG